MCLRKRVADFSPASPAQTLGKNRPWAEAHLTQLGDGTGRTKTVSAIFDALEASPGTQPSPEAKPDTILFVTASKAGTVFTIQPFTLPAPLPPVLTLHLVAPADFVKGNTLVINGKTTPLADAANSPLPDNAWKQGAGVELLYFIGLGKAFFKAGAAGSAVAAWSIFPGVAQASTSPPGLYIPGAVATQLFRINAGFNALGKKIVKVQAGESHVVVLLETGEVYTAGSNRNGQLCRVSPDGSPTVSNLGKVEGIPPIKDIAAGWRHTILITQDGVPYGAGLNNYKQCGHNGTTGSPTISNLAPVALSLVEGAAAGMYHSAFWLSNGSAYTCGYNTNGQLGRSDDAMLGRVVDLPSGVRSIACGYNTTYFHLYNFEVYDCGSNSHGQLGRITTASAVPVLGRVVGLPAGINVVRAGGNTAAFILANKDAYTCGANDLGQLGSDKTSGSYTTSNLSLALTDITDASLGGETIAFRQSNGNVLTSGKAGSGELGRETSGTKEKTLAMIPSLPPALSVCCGFSSTYIVTDTGLYTCGSNVYGELARIGAAGAYAAPNLEIIAYEKFGLPDDVAAEGSLMVVPGSMDAAADEHIPLYRDEFAGIRLPVAKVYQTRGGKILELPFTCKGSA